MTKEKAANLMVHCLVDIVDEESAVLHLQERMLRLGRSLKKKMPPIMSRMMPAVSCCLGVGSIILKAVKKATANACRAIPQ